MTEGTRARGVIAFLAAGAIAIVAVLVYIARVQAPGNLPPPPSSVTVTPAPGGVPSASPSTAPSSFVDAVPTGPLILFRDASPGDLFGRLAMVRLPVDKQPRQIGPLSCDRVHYAGGWGVCMVTDDSRMPVRYHAFVFDRTFTKGPLVRLTGPPIRARVSPDGRRAALTVFETGHSYADEEFSTRTIIVDTASGRQIADVESFAIEKDGKPFKRIDFNFWGVTFARDGDEFYATLKTRKSRYLVKGSVDARRAAVIHDAVECPSLSPDGTRIVFKKPLEDEIGWRLNVLDLATNVERPLNQSRRSVDDQVDWFDNDHVVYHDSATEGTGIWVLSIDGITPPQLLLPNAYSPAVQR